MVVEIVFLLLDIMISVIFKDVNYWGFYMMEGQILWMHLMP